MHIRFFTYFFTLWITLFILPAKSLRDGDESQNLTDQESICVGALVLAITYFVLVCFCWLIFLCHRCRAVSEQKRVNHGDIFTVLNYDGRIAYEDIIRATHNFDSTYCIGAGSCGRVYRAQLPNGKIVALKKLRNREGEIPATRERNIIRNEVRVLSEIKHRNILKLLGFCLHDKCMFLIYQYMSRGSLFGVLRSDSEAKELDWVKRVNVVKGVSNALAYLHHDCIPPIVHRDISSSNILLDSELQPFVSDFGSATLLNPHSSNQYMLMGTYGYIAPVVVLETMLGKFPGELISSFSSTRYCEQTLLKDLLDPRLPPPVDSSIVGEVVLMVTLALACLHPNPKSRPTMLYLSKRFLTKNLLLRMPLEDIRMSQLMSIQVQ